MMEQLMSIFNNKSLSVETRIELIKKAYNALNFEYAANAFDEVAKELIKALEIQTETSEQELTIRDQIAIAAMNGLLSNSGGVVQANSYSGTGYANGSAEYTALWAYELADAMLEERGK